MEERQIAWGQGNYCAREDGAIINSLNNRLLKASSAREGKPLRVFLAKYEKDGIRKSTMRFVKVLVWEAFNGLIGHTDKIEVIDGDENNPSLHNLRKAPKGKSGITKEKIPNEIKFMVELGGKKYIETFDRNDIHPAIEWRAEMIEAYNTF